MWFLWPSIVRWRSRLGRRPARRAHGRSNRKGLESVGEGRSTGEEAAVTLLYTAGAEGSSDSVRGGGRSREFGRSAPEKIEMRQRLTSLGRETGRSSEEEEADDSEGMCDGGRRKRSQLVIVLCC
ncbi:hypothetical protein B296_00037988 [Ensete ventricosum]|uniref:Uncharacterized protein n=1 Tax=Ensete ventricosum TaxID=4639 RepID=A0A426Y379_ENSVE|nr:hypothetical protein B296_00037988 [Ensete ventricosum]